MRGPRGLARPDRLGAGTADRIAAAATGRAARAVGLRMLAEISVGTLTVHETSASLTFGAGAPVAAVSVRSPAAWSALLRGSRGMAEAYAAGAWDSPDLVALVRLAALNSGRIDRIRRRLVPLREPVDRLRARVRPHDRRRSRDDIAAHYDLGNELFVRMLDPTMMYSCARFEKPGMSLEEAQRAKLEDICEKLGLRAGDRVLEIGTGWGAFAIHAAATRRCRVTTVTISAEQYRHAVEAVAHAGLADRVTVLMRDYRDLRGGFDKLVSIEMIEAVGWREWDTYFATCSRLVSDRGAMLLQAICIDDRLYETEKATRSFIKDVVFPGGALPSLEVITRETARRTDMQVFSVEDITRHYVETLRHWRENFLAHAEELAGLGYDDRFRRIWTLYLAYCEAGFAERRIRDLQFLLVKPGSPLAEGDGRPLAAVAAAEWQQQSDMSRLDVAS